MRSTFFLLLFFTATLRADQSALIAEIVRQSPALEAARQEWQAAAQEPAIVSAWPDPMLSYGYYFTRVQTRTGPLQSRVGLSQKFLFPGKLSTARRKARAAAEVTYWKYRAAIRDTVAQTRTLLAELARVDGASAVLREQEILLRQTATSAEALYETNRGKLPDVIRAKIAAEDLHTQLSSLGATRLSVLALLKALRGPSETPLQIPDTAAKNLPPLPSLAEAMKRSLVTNEDLRAAESAIAREAYGVRQADLDYYPDVTVGIDHTQSGERSMEGVSSGGQDPVMGTLTMNLPIWWQKLGAQKKAAEARHEATISRLAQMSVDTTARVEGAHAMARAALEQRNRYAGQIIPQARRASESTLSDYTAGMTPLTDVLAVQQARLEAEIGLVERHAAYLKALADLERAIGASLP